MLAICLFILLHDNIRAAFHDAYIDTCRTFHHLLVFLCPSIFNNDPRRGPRHLSPYLYTNGLTPAVTLVPPHKGCQTGEQLTRYIVPVTNVQVNLIPTDYEASAGLHPSTQIQTTAPARPAVVHTIKLSLQQAIDTGRTPAEATLNFINQIDYHLTHNTRPNLIPLRPPPGANLSVVVLAHPGKKELAMATNFVLRQAATRRKLGAFHQVCFDQHVRIAESEHLSRNDRRMRLDMLHGVVAVNSFWPQVPH